MSDSNRTNFANLIMTQSGAQNWGEVLNNNLRKIDNMGKSINNRVDQIQKNLGEAGYVSFMDYEYILLYSDKILCQDLAAQQNIILTAQQITNSSATIDILTDTLHTDTEKWKAAILKVNENVLLDKSNFTYTENSTNATLSWANMQFIEGDTISVTVCKEIDVANAVNEFFQLGYINNDNYYIPPTDDPYDYVYVTDQNTNNSAAVVITNALDDSNVLIPSQHIKYYGDIVDYTGFYVQRNYPYGSQVLNTTSLQPYDRAWENGEILVKKSTINTDGTKTSTFIKFKQSFGGYYKPSDNINNGVLSFEKTTPAQAPIEVSVNLPTAVSFIINGGLQAAGSWTFDQGGSGEYIVTTNLVSQLPPAFWFKTYEVETIDGIEYYEECFMSCSIYKDTVWKLKFTDTSGEITSETASAKRYIQIINFQQNT